MGQWQVCGRCVAGGVAGGVRWCEVLWQVVWQVVWEVVWGCSSGRCGSVESVAGVAGGRWQVAKPLLFLSPLNGRLRWLKPEREKQSVC